MIDGDGRVVWVVFGLVSLSKSFSFFYNSHPSKLSANEHGLHFQGGLLGCQSTEFMALPVSEKQNLIV